MISLTLPLRTVSESNAHTHWRVRQRRAKTQRSIAAMSLRVHAPRVPCVVTLTRIAPRALDDDNLQGSAKHLRDGVADALGVKDNDPRVQWRYAQERGKPREYAVRIEIGIADP